MIDFGFGVQLGPMSTIDPQTAYQWRNDPRIYKWCRQYEPLEWDNHVDWLKSVPKRQDIKMYVVFFEGRPVGVCGLTSIDHVNNHAEFSLYISPEEQGKTLGERALKTLCAHGFNALGLYHIFGETFEGNLAASMFEKVGFQKEGTRRKFYFRDGKHIDAHLYSILFHEFKTKWNC